MLIFIVLVGLFILYFVVSVSMDIWADLSGHKDYDTYIIEKKLKALSIKNSIPEELVFNVNESNLNLNDVKNLIEKKFPKNVYFPVNIENHTTENIEVRKKLNYIEKIKVDFISNNTLQIIIEQIHIWDLSKNNPYYKTN
jgi:hypothetical protein